MGIFCISEQSCCRDDMKKYKSSGRDDKGMLLQDLWVIVEAIF